MSRGSHKVHGCPSVFHDAVRQEEQRSLSRSYLYTLSWLALVILESSRRLIEALEDSAVLLLHRLARRSITFEYS